MSNSSSSVHHPLDDDCNDIWNEDVFYDLDLHLVWHDSSGNWIPYEYREAYYSEENNPMDWYSYCDYLGIQWSAPRILPSWAIADMDQYYRDKYNNSRLDITEDN